MKISVWFTFLKDALKLGLDVLKPKDKETIKQINDKSFRQNFLFSFGNDINNNYFFIRGDDGEYFVANASNIPKRVMDVIQKQHDAPIGKTNSNISKINIHSIETDDDFKEYLRFFNSFYDPILSRAFPYMSYKFVSVIILSSYIEELMNGGYTEKAKSLKQSIEKYGIEEKKLCNLCLNGYIKNKFEKSLDRIFSETQNFNNRRIMINELIKDIFEYAEQCILFVYDEDPMKIAKTAFSMMKTEIPHVKIHIDNFIENDYLGKKLMSELNILNVLNDTDYIIIRDSKNYPPTKISLEKQSFDIEKNKF